MNNTRLLRALLPWYYSVHGENVHLSAHRSSPGFVDIKNQKLRKYGEYVVKWSMPTWRGNTYYSCRVALSWKYSSIVGQIWPEIHLEGTSIEGGLFSYHARVDAGIFANSWI